MKKTTNFDAFAQFADAQLSKEEMKNIKGGAEWEGGDPGTGGGDPGTGGGDINAPSESFHCYFTPLGSAPNNPLATTIKVYATMQASTGGCANPPSGMRCDGCRVW